VPNEVKNIIIKSKTKIMFKNYLKIAWRSLKTQPFFTFINTFGLAIGMAGALLISLYIYDELSFDKMFADADSIYRIDTDIKFGGAEIRGSESSAPMAEAMQRDFSQVASTIRFRNRGSALIRKTDTETNTKELNVTFADSTFFDFFGIELLVGDVKTALSEPNTLILTKTAAEKHFGKQKALGQSLLLNNIDSYTVTGVIDDLPKNSMLRDHSVFMAMAGYNPQTAPAFWERMAEKSGSRPPEFLSTHPDPSNRIEDLNRIMPKAMEYYNAR
jgi:putative ABC transport system permease protein